MPSSFDEEVTRLHDFFEAWFSGGDGLSVADFDDALADDFMIISPDGRLSSRAEIVHIVEQARNSGPVEISVVTPRLIVDGHVTVGTYEEHQIRAGRSTQRISTAVLSVEPDAPGGWLWHLVHETWLPGGAPGQA
ncbi:MAG: hypothetical protein ACR2N9_06340 [Acidimicrobiia bacterium]